MRTISQREMRNDSGQVLREVEQGQQFTVTRRGTPVAKIVPYQELAQASRPARRPPVFDVSELVQSDVTSEQALADLRDEER